LSLEEWRKQASERSGGTSGEPIKRMVLRMLKETGARGSLLDFGAGRGELLGRLYLEEGFQDLAGADLFPRPPELAEAIAWHQHDLNDAVSIDRQFDVVVCSETIEHLENPRHVFRTLNRLLRPGGTLILTMPNQEAIRSYAGLILSGHFTHFLGNTYPAHITALLRMDLRRMCEEAGFTPPKFYFTNEGGIPKLPRLKWQSISFGLLRGRLFSDNVGMTTQRKMS